MFKNVFIVPLFQRRFNNGEDNYIPLLDESNDVWFTKC